MSVLWVEHRGSILFAGKQALEAEGYRVLEASTPADAQHHWERRSAIPISCVILDPRIPSTGLSEKQKARAGVLSGWIWLKDQVLLDMPEMGCRTIIFTDCLDELLPELAEAEEMGIQCIRKESNLLVPKDLVVRVGKILTMDWGGRERVAKRFERRY